MSLAACLRDLGVRALLLDVDGVLVDGERPIPGAVEAVRRLCGAGVPFRLATNTTMRTAEAIAAAGRAMGFPLEASDVHSPVEAARAVLQRRQAEAGRPLRVHPLLLPGVLPAFEGLLLSTAGPADVVLVGDMGRGFDFRTLNRAFRLLLEGAELLALQKNRYWTRGGKLYLDAGPFVVALEHASGRPARVVGKPSRDFFLAALERLGVPPAEAAMVGDDLESDIGGAQAAGLKGILVRTGKSRAPAPAGSSVRPDLILDSVAGVLDPA